MARDIVDDRLIGALHVRALTHRGFAHDPVAERTAFQVGTLDALIDGRYDGDTTMGELLAHGDLGLGTVQHLGGELIVIDGEAFVVDQSFLTDARTFILFSLLKRFDPSKSQRATFPNSPCHRRSILRLPAAAAVTHAPATDARLPTSPGIASLHATHLSACPQGG